MLLIGSSLAAFQLSRFIAADINPPASRGRAIANVILGGAAGSIAGPLLTGPLSQAATSLGYDPLAGPFFAPLLLLAAAALLVFAGLRPAPETLAADVARRFPDASSSSSQPPRSPGQVFHQPAAALALAAMVISQVVMMSLMLITALHMNDHQHSLADISVVISSHTFGMFAFSVVSGRLADRLGRVPVILMGAAALSASGLLATVSPNVIPLAFALFLLGLGWNFCFVGASSLLADQLAPSERSRIQGINDMLLNGSSAAGSLATGLVYSSFGYFEIAFFSAGVSALLFMVLLVYRISQQQPRMAPE